MDSIKSIIGKQGVHTKYPKFLSTEESNYICSIVDKYEEQILALPNQYQTAYSGQLTGQFHVFNWLSIPELAEMKLHERLFQLDELQPFKQMIVQCWCNTLRKGEGLVLHRHAHTDEPKDRNDTVEIFHRRPPQFYSCNIFLKGRHNKTWFESLGDLEHEQGDLMIFDNHLLHQVEDNPYDDVRYSIAFDIYPKMMKQDSLDNKIRYERTTTDKN